MVQQLCSAACSDSHNDLTLPYFTLPPGQTSSYTCLALRPYQFNPMCVPAVTIVTMNGLALKP